MAITREDIKKIKEALKEDFDNLGKRLETNLEARLFRKMDDKFAILISKLPDWSQFATKSDIAGVMERLSSVEDIAVGINRKFDQEFVFMQMQIDHHREWLEKHDKQFEIIDVTSKSKRKSL